MSTSPRRLGRYELRQLLGRGSIGEVWKAYDLQSRHEVAVKIVHTDLQADPHFLSHFTQEGQKLTSLQNPNIVRVQDVAVKRGEGDTVAYLVMDSIEGPTLTDYLQKTSHKGNYPSPHEIVYLFTSLGVAIDYAHQHGIVHGDLKPENILLNTQRTTNFSAGEPMLTDFGLVNLLSNTGSTGNPAYMSPEQVQGHPANNRSDVYSLGVILYELCTGIRPFRDPSSVAVMMQHTNMLPTPPMLINPDIPPALSEVILRAMAKDTATRFPMASLLATAIADAYSIRSTITVSQEQKNEAEQEYHTTSGQQEVILGVSQPLSRLAGRAYSSSSNSQPLPTISRPLPTLSGKHSAIQPTAKTPVAANKTDTAPTSSLKTTAVPPTSLKTPAVSPRTSATTGKIPTLPSTSMKTPTVPQPPAPQWSPPPAPIPVRPSYPVKSTSRRFSFLDRRMYIAIAALVLLLLILGGIIGTTLLRAWSNGGPIVGHAFFVDSALGHEDMLRLELQNISAPPQGKSYFGWLQGTAHTTIPLGELNVSNGSISFTYEGDTQHTNLLSVAQGVLITLEDTGSHAPTPQGNSVYKAQLDPTALPYIQNVLYSLPNFPVKGGMIANMFESIKSMNDKAVSIVDSIQNTHDYPLATRQAVRIIETIDGTLYARSSGDLPAKLGTNMNVSVGLISSPTQVGYIDTIAAQLDKIQKTTDAASSIHLHADNVMNAITNLRDWIQKIRSYDVQVLKAANLTDPAIVSVALQLKQVAAYSYTGRTIPPNEDPLPILGSAGAYQAYVEAQYMATLDIRQA